MTTWSEFRTQVRRTVLNDTRETPRWSDAVLLDCMNWAQRTFCAHTAVATAVQYDASGRGPYPVPGNNYERIEESGIVYTQSSSSTLPANFDFINPVTYTPGLDLTASKGFYVWPKDSLYLMHDLQSGSLLTIRYYAFYNDLVNDASVLTIPRWAEQALAWLVGANAMTTFAVKSANIRQWSESPEKGDPEDNSLRAQHRWFLELYEREINKHAPQIRENAYRDYVG